MFPSLPLFKIASQPFKRSQFGLFHGKTKQYGNNVPHSKHKTRRTWLPNVQRKRLHSEILGEDIKLRFTTRALRTIHKYGGLDNYILKTKHQLLGWEGMRIRVLLHEAQKGKAIEEVTLPVSTAEEEIPPADGEGVNTEVELLHTDRTAPMAAETEMRK